MQLKNSFKSDSIGETCAGFNQLGQSFDVHDIFCADCKRPVDFKGLNEVLDLWNCKL